MSVLSPILLCFDLMLLSSMEHYHPHHYCCSDRHRGCFDAAMNVNYRCARDPLEVTCNVVRSVQPGLLFTLSLLVVVIHIRSF